MTPYTDADLVEIRQAFNDMLDATGTIWRSPEAAGGKVSDPTAIADTIPCCIRPMPTEGPLAAAMQGLAGTRVALLGLVPWGTDIRTGDEIHVDARALLVEGVGTDWPAGIPLALSEVRP